MERDMFEDLRKVLENENLTEEEKTRLIKEAGEAYRRQVDAELNWYLLKQYGGAALEIGSAALPMGGVGKAGAAIGKELLKKQLGRSISENIGSGILSGAASGGMFALGDAIMNDKSPIRSTVEGVIGGALTGGTLGVVGSNIQKAVRGQTLRNFGNIDELSPQARKEFFEKGKDFYRDYIQDIQLTKGDSTFGFSRRGMQEQAKWNPKQVQNYSELVKEIKNATRLPDAPNLKPNQKPNVDHYELYQGDNGLHHIEVAKNGEKRFYITKDTLGGTPRDTIPGSSKGSINSVTDGVENFNPSQLGSLENGKNLQKDTPKSTPRITNTDAPRSPKDIITDSVDNFNPSQVGSFGDLSSDIIKEVGSNPAYSHHNRALELEPNTIVTDGVDNFNPSQSGSLGNGKNLQKDTPKSIIRTTSTGAPRSPKDIVTDGVDNFNSSQLGSLENGKNLQKDTPKSSDRTTNTGTPRSPKNIVTDGVDNFNPSQSGSLGNGKNLQKDTPKSTPRTTNTDAPRSPKGIVTDSVEDFNPSQLGSFGNSPSDINSVPLQGYIQKGPFDDIPPANPFANNNNGQPTGYAAPIDEGILSNLSIPRLTPFTPDEIGKMSTEEFTRNERAIMEQLKNGQIVEPSQKVDYSTYKNPQSGKERIFTREDLDKMTTKEYSENEKEIYAQMNSIGIPFKNEVSHGTNTYSKEKSQRQNSGDGKWVTINGHHVFIEK